MLRTLALAALGLVVQVWAGGHAHEHLAVVRVFSTDEEVMLLNGSKMLWDTVVPCTTKSNMSAIDLILVYSKDLASNSMANEVVMDIVNGFQMKMDMEMYGSTNVTMGTMYDWMECFAAIKSMSAMLNPEQDVYDSNGYTTNKHWVSGPNHVFKNILDAMFTGAFMGMYDSFFLMEMDAVPIKDNWLDQFEMEAHEVHDNNQAVRGSQYLGDKWDLFKHQMPVYLVDHINGNAIYNLKHPWTKYLYDTFTMVGDASMMEEMAFDVAFAMITMAAMSGDPMYSANWTGDNMTYNTHTMLVGNYANTLLNTSFEFGTYIRHGSGKNLFENLDDNDVTLGVAYFDHQGHFMETVPTHHPFKKILGIAYFDQPNTTQTISAPGGDVTMMMQKAMDPAYYHLCEIAKLVDTEWFALTDNYHIVKAPVSVLMDESGQMKKPVLPYVLKDSKYCGERPNCKASMEQAEDLFSINLNYHHDKYEVLYKTADARMFCAAWDEATKDKSWGNCSLAFGPTADDYIAWKISSPNYNIADEFTPKDKTRYGWRAWTSLWNPAPVDDRMCDTTLYGVKEYLETLGNISTCAVDYVENATGCMASTHCMWRPMFESGVCLLNPMSVMPTTTVEGAVYSVVETTLELTVADAQAVIDDAALNTAMRTQFATLVDVSVDNVMLEFQTSRRLSNNIRRLSEKLYAIFTVTMDSVADAEAKQVAIETLSLSQTTEAITMAAADAGFTGSLEVMGKTTALVPATTTTTTTTTTTAATDSNTTTTTMMSTTEALPQPSFAQHFGSFSVLALLAAAFMN